MCSQSGMPDSFCGIQGASRRSVDAAIFKVQLVSLALLFRPVDVATDAAVSVAAVVKVLPAKLLVRPSTLCRYLGVLSFVIILVANPNSHPIDGIEEHAQSLAHLIRGYGGATLIITAVNAEAPRLVLLGATCFIYLGHCEPDGRLGLVDTNRHLLSPLPSCATMAQHLGLYASTNGGSLLAAILLVCWSYALGRETARAGVPEVVCNEDLAEDGGMKYLENHLFRHLVNQGARTVATAFADATDALVTTRPFRYGPPSRIQTDDEGHRVVGRPALFANTGGGDVTESRPSSPPVEPPPLPPLLPPPPLEPMPSSTLIETVAGEDVLRGGPLANMPLRRAPAWPSHGRAFSSDEDGDGPQDYDEAYEKALDEVYDALIAQADAARLPQPRELSRAAMLLAYLEDVFWVMNEPGLTTTRTAYFEAYTDVLVALDTLMAELDEFFGLGDAERYKPLLHAFRDAILNHLNCGVEGCVEGDGGRGYGGSKDELDSDEGSESGDATPPRKKRRKGSASPSSDSGASSSSSAGGGLNQCPTCGKAFDAAFHTCPFCYVNTH